MCCYFQLLQVIASIPRTTEAKTNFGIISRSQKCQPVSIKLREIFIFQPSTHNINTQNIIHSRYCRNQLQKNVSDQTEAVFFQTRNLKAFAFSFVTVIMMNIRSLCSKERVGVKFKQSICAELCLISGLEATLQKESPDQ